MTQDSNQQAAILKEKLLYSIQSLCEIGEELSSIEKFDSSSQSVLHLVMGTLMISKAAILLYNEDTKNLEVVASRGVQNGAHSVPLPDNMFNKLHRANEPISVANPDHDLIKRYFEENKEFVEELHSHYWLPLKVKSRLLGVVSISKKFMNQDYEPVDLELLNIIVQQLSIAVNNYYLIKNLKETNFQLNRKLLELETLYDLGIAIGSIMEVEDLAEQILMNAVGLTDASAGFLALKSDNGLELASSINVPENEISSLEEYKQIKAILEENETIIDNSGNSDGNPFGFLKVLLVPLGGQHQVLGVIGLADKESRDGILNFSDADKRLLQNFASQAGIAIENAKFYKESLEKERLERELQVAATIQQNILPHKLPDIPGFEFAATTIPSRFVGGDHYDFYEEKEDVRLISIADVSGKGIPAALLVSTLHATQHAVVESEADPREIVRRISKSIFRSSLSNKFITYFLLQLDQKKKRILTVNAGHNYPLLVSSNGKMEKLKKGGLVLGLMPEVEYEAEEKTLKKGDILVLFTDGVTEAMNNNDEEYSDERLEELVLKNRHLGAQEMHDLIMEDVSKFTQGAPQHDDITLLIIKVTE